ncbi:hypothetical protein CCGE525_34540 (plasmid) [Rhizobium jaguaris]|uniref:Uncharacterized protein n=1 Tax=Rhizobium jaguaris TaxID=1312183 RepID=A0A387G7W1_9HYPH|nr:hypothetical protein CCGE525_34540 [Rhizobium jaguaris]
MSLYLSIAWIYAIQTQQHSSLVIQIDIFTAQRPSLEIFIREMHIECEFEHGAVDLRACAVVGQRELPIHHASHRFSV